jgi:replicative DNA helicase
MAIDSVERNYDKGARDFVREALDSIEARKNGKIQALPTGIDRLDLFLGGFHDSDLVVIGARPAMGKTAVMLNFAMAANAPVGIISGEQGADQVGERLFSMSGSVPVQSMRRANLQAAEWDALSKAATRLIEQERIFLNDHPSPDLSLIQRQARKWRHQHGIRALFVDYIQSIRGGDSKAPKHERIGDVVRGLKSLARELEIPVIALAQVARVVETRPDKRPSMADLSDSSEIEKEADQVITLYRDEVYNENSADAGIIEFRICKNRHGEVNFVRAAWRGEFMQVRNIAGGYE